MPSFKKSAPIQNEPTSGAGPLDESGVRTIPREAREALKAIEAKRVKPEPRLKIAAEPVQRPMRGSTEDVCPKMLEAHVSLVHQVVAPIARRLPANVLRDDLLAAGLFGLVDSLRKNGGDGGTTFEWYARTRIRGAVLDELRAQDWLKRRARDAVDAASQREEPETDAVAFVGLDELSAADEEEYLASFGMSPDLAYEIKETNHNLALALDTLPKRERQVIDMLYYEEAKCREVAAKLKVCEPRISQLHAKALERLRTAFTPKRFRRATLGEVRPDALETESDQDDWVDTFPMNDSPDVV